METKDCPICDGYGEPHIVEHLGPPADILKCPNCNGTGRLSEYIEGS